MSDHQFFIDRLTDYDVCFDDEIRLAFRSMLPQEWHETFDDFIEARKRMIKLSGILLGFLSMVKKKDIQEFNKLKSHYLEIFDDVFRKGRRRNDPFVEAFERQIRQMRNLRGNPNWVKGVSANPGGKYVNDYKIVVTEVGSRVR